MEKLYKVIADYRPNNPNKPDYYVYAESKKQAKKKFQNLFTWLKVYEVSELTDDDIERISSEPRKHIIIR